MKRQLSQQSGVAKSSKLKKLLVCLFVVITCVAMLLIGTVSAAAASTGIVAGDANGDGVVDGKDVTRIRKYLADYNPYLGTSSVTLYPGADANEDGIISEADVRIILNSLANYDESQPVEPVVKHSYYIKDECVYYYGEDGFMCTDVTINGYYFGSDGKLVADKVLIDIDGETYYIESGKLAHGYRVIDNQIFFFTEDGSMLKSAMYETNTYSAYGYIIADREFVTIGDDTYYMYNSIITYGDEIIDNRVYHFGEDGVMARSESVGDYSYGPDGYMITNDVFVPVDGYIYFVHDGFISFEYQFINGRIYYFGQSGRMIMDTYFAGNYHGEDGYIIADEQFVLVDNSFYYLIDNVVTTGYRIISDMIYLFDTESGAMFTDATVDGYYFCEYGFLYADKEFVTIEGATYYLDNCTVTYGYAFIDSKIYFFDENGVMAQSENVGDYFYCEDGYLEADNEFVTIEGYVYYLSDNTITYEYDLIDGKIYYFGLDGKMIKDTDFAGNYHGVDGYIIADEEFILAGDNIYYLIDNVITTGYKIIGDVIFLFDTESGAMFTDAIVDGYYFCEYGFLYADKEFVTIEGATYYLDNCTVTYGYAFIDSKIYFFDENGVMAQSENVGDYFYCEDGYLEADNEFVTIEGYVYYLSDNTITYEYDLIDGKIYYFGLDGKMIKDTDFAGNYHGVDGYIIADEEFILAGDNIYYLVDNVITTGYLILDQRIYRFSEESGAMFIDETVDGYYYSVNGYITVSEKTTIVIDETVYWITTENLVYEETSISGVIYGSDSDFDFANNKKLSGVNVTLAVAGEIFTTTTDENGYFAFPSIPDAEINLLFEKTEYDDVIILDAEAESSVTVIMDKSATTSLIGKVTAADGDASLLNNASLAGVMVEIVRTSSTNKLSTFTYSDANGEFVFDFLNEGVYVITYTLDGYVIAEQIVCVTVDAEAEAFDLGAVELVKITNTENGYVSGVITDTKSKLPVKGLTIIVREGIDNVIGKVVMTIKTDDSGAYKVGPIAAGNYTLVIVDERELENEDERYAELVINISVLPGTYTKNRNFTATNLVGLEADSIKIVLSWGSAPKDLDAHLNAAIGENNYHVSYLESAPGMSLDYDSTTSYGPETITITEVADGVYTYYVHNRSDENNEGSEELQNSGASVKVYINGSTAPVYSFYAPDGIGTYWHVFTYDSTTGEFTIVNEIGNSIN